MACPECVLQPTGSTSACHEVGKRLPYPLGIDGHLQGKRYGGTCDCAHSCPGAHIQGSHYWNSLRKWLWSLHFPVNLRLTGSHFFNFHFCVEMHVFNFTPTPCLRVLPVVSDRNSLSQVSVKILTSTCPVSAQMLPSPGGLPDDSWPQRRGNNLSQCCGSSSVLPRELQALRGLEGSWPLKPNYTRYAILALSVCIRDWNYSIIPFESKLLNF